MKKIFLIFLLFNNLFTNAQFSSPYKFSLKNEVCIPVISVSMIGTAFLLERKRHNLTLETINSLNRNSINRFDRNATLNWNPIASKWSDRLLYSSITFPLLFLLDKNSRQDFDKVAVIYSEIILLNAGLTNLTKELLQRKRPYVYNSNVPFSIRMNPDATHSFFSGHVSVVTSMSFGFAQMYSSYYPNSKAKPGVWFAAATLPFATAVLRNKAGKHFWSDVIVGYIVGASIGILVPKFHNNQ